MTVAPCVALRTLLSARQCSAVQLRQWARQVCAPRAFDSASTCRARPGRSELERAAAAAGRTKFLAVSSRAGSRCQRAVVGEPRRAPESNPVPVPSLRAAALRAPCRPEGEARASGTKPEAGGQAHQACQARGMRRRGRPRCSAPCSSARRTTPAAGTRRWQQVSRTL